MDDFKDLDDYENLNDLYNLDKADGFIRPCFQYFNASLLRGNQLIYKYNFVFFIKFWPHLYQRENSMIKLKFPLLL